MAARRDAALTHAATEGRRSEGLEPPVPPGGELHVQDAALEERKRTWLTLSPTRIYLYFFFPPEIKDAAVEDVIYLRAQRKNTSPERARLIYWSACPISARPFFSLSSLHDISLRHHICLLLSYLYFLRDNICFGLHLQNGEPCTAKRAPCSRISHWHQQDAGRGWAGLGMSRSLMKIHARTPSAWHAPAKVGGEKRKEKLDLERDRAVGLAEKAKTALKRLLFKGRGRCDRHSPEGSAHTLSALRTFPRAESGSADNWQ